MVRIAWRMLRERPANLIATFVALWLAVAIVTACGAMLESGIRYHGTVQRYAAAPVLVATTDIRTTEGHGDDQDTESIPLAARAVLPRSLRDRIADVPGVRAAVADVAVPAGVVAGTARAAVELHPWSAAALAPFPLRTGVAPTTGSLVIGAALAHRLHVRPGSHIRLTTAAGTRTFTVSGTAGAIGATTESPTVFTADSTVLAQHGPQVIAVVPEPGTATTKLAQAVRAVLPPVPDRPTGAYPHVFTGAYRGSVETPEVDNAREFVVAVSSVFGGCALMIAVLVIAGTVGLSVKQRNRDVALLRAIAATPRQVRRMVVRETATLALLAGGTGIWLGMAFAGWLRGQFVARGLAPDTFRTHLSWLPPVVAAAAALAIGVVAAWVASLRASRMRPTAALTETAVDRNGVGVLRALFGLVALGGGITLSVVSSRIGGDDAAGISVATVFTLTIAVALLSPLLIRAAVATVGRLLLLVGVTGRLAVATTGTSARRLSGVLSALVLAVALGGSLWFVSTSTEHVARSQANVGLRADHVVVPPAPGLLPADAARMRRTNGVTAATGMAHGTLFAERHGLSDYSVEGVDPGGLQRTLDLGLVDGTLADLHGDVVAMDTLTANALNLRVGASFTGWFGDGAPARLRLVATYTRGLGFAAFTVPLDVLLPHTATGLVDTVFVRTNDPPALRSELRSVAAGSTLLARSAYQVQFNRNLVENGWTNKVVTAVLVIYVVIAAVNSLIMYVLGRRREFAVLRLTGTTRPQVLRMVGLEQALLLGLALVLGAAIAAATLLPMVKGVTGSAAPYIPLPGWFAVIGGVLLCGALATMLPARRVLRVRPVDAIGIRE